MYCDSSWLKGINGISMFQFAQILEFCFIAILSKESNCLKGIKIKAKSILCTTMKVFSRSLEDESEKRREVEARRWSGDSLKMFFFLFLDGTRSEKVMLDWMCWRSVIQILEIVVDSVEIFFAILSRREYFWRRKRLWQIQRKKTQKKIGGLDN